MQMVVRLAVEADADAIHDLSQYLGYAETSQTQATEKLLNIMKSDEDEVYVSEIDGQIVGWLHVFYARRLASADFYEIGGLLVHPEFRGQGIGRHLVENSLENYKGKVRVRCNETRIDAHNFYKSIGFNSAKVQHVFEKY